MTVEEAVGRNIDKIRIAHGLSVRKFAKRIGYSAPPLLRWLKGKGSPGAYALFRISKEFGVTIDSLFEGADE